MPRSDFTAPTPSHNGLLGALPADEYDGLLPNLELTPLASRATLYQPGEPLTHVYFPVSGVVCLLTVLSGGKGVEVGVVGREGLVGLPAFLGSGHSPGRCLVQVPGHAYRLPREAFLRASGHLDCLLLRYTHWLLCQVSQSVACMAAHSLERRLCRWLLMLHSRAGGRPFPLTHSILASMLGVRRASVSDVVARLQKRGLVHCGRGRLSLPDPSRLEGCACECHGAVQAEWDRLFT